MNQVEFLVIFETILYGAIVTQLIYGWSQLVLKRGEYKPYWLHYLMTIILFLNTVQNYYQTGDLENYNLVSGSLSFLFVIVTTPTLLSISCFILIPGDLSGVDFRNHLVRFRYPLITALSFLFGSNAVTNVLAMIHYHEPVVIYMWLPHVIFIVLYWVFAITKNLKFAEVIILLNLGMILLFLWYR